MSVNNGSPVDASNTNAAYMSRKVNTDTVGKVDLKDSGSADVIDAQQVINTAKADIVTNAGDIDTNTTNISNNDTDIANLDTRVGDNETDIITINNTLPLKADLVGGKIPTSQLPTSAMEYLGNWNASTNTPTLIDGTGNNGDVYRVSVAGSQDLGSGSISFAVGDWIIYNGTVWEKSLNSSEVISVNSQTGVIVLDADDIAESTTKFWDLKNNRDATVDPTINDDSGDNYAIGSTWFNKTSGILYVLQDASIGAAVWIVASGSGDGGSLDFFYTENFETTVAVDLTVTGTWTKEDNTTTPISGDSSIKMTQASGSSGAQITAGNIALDPNQKDTTISLQGRYLYDGNNNEIDFVIYDVTNTKVLSITSLPSSSAAKTFRVLANTLSTTANIKWYFEVMTENIGAILEFDNIEGRINPLPTVESVQVNSVGLEGNDGRVITAGTEDIHYGGSGDGWTSVGDTHYYTAQGSNSIIELNGSVQWTTLAARNIAVYKNGALYRKLESQDASLNAAFVFQYTSFEGEFIAGDQLSIRESSNAGTLSNVSDGHFLNINETAVSANVVFEGAPDTDSVEIRVEGAVGSGSVGTRVRKFSDAAVENKHVKYVPDAVNGDYFEIKKAGLFHVAYQDTRGGGGAGGMGISKNASSLTTNYVSLPISEQLGFQVGDATSFNDYGTANASVPLAIGDKIRAHTHSALTTTTPTAFFSITKQPEPSVVSVPVTNEVENVYSARVANNGTLTTTSQNAPLLLFNRVSLGVINVTYNRTLAEIPAINVDPSNTVNNRDVNITSITTSGFTVTTLNNALGLEDFDIDVIIQLQGADYKAPKGYFLGNMSRRISSASGVEYDTGEIRLGKKVYAMDFDTTVSMTQHVEATLATVSTGLQVVGLYGYAKEATYWYQLDFNGSSGQVNFMRYNHTTGVISSSVSATNSEQNFTIEYIK